MQQANLQACVNILYGAGRLGVSNQATCDMVLVRVGQLEGYWSLLAASQILLGIRDSGYSEVPQGAGEMLRYTLRYMP